MSLLWRPLMKGHREELFPLCGTAPAERPDSSSRTPCQCERQMWWDGSTGSGLSAWSHKLGPVLGEQLKRLRFWYYNCHGNSVRWW